MLNVVVDMRLHEEGYKKLQAIPGLNIRHTAKPNEEGDRPEPSDLIKDAHVWLGSYLPTNHEEMKSLQFVQLASAGYSQLYGKNLAARNVKACNALGVFDVPIAEWNVAMMVNCIATWPFMMIHIRSVCNRLFDLIGCSTGWLEPQRGTHPGTMDRLVTARRPAGALLHAQRVVGTPDEKLAVC